MDLSVRRETYGQANYAWLDSAHGTDACRSVTLDLSTFTEGTHYPDGYIPSGTKLGKITAGGLFGIYDNAAEDGTEVLVGFLLEPVKVTAGSNPIGAILEHGRVIAANLPFAIDAGGIADVAGRITFGGA